MFSGPGPQRIIGRMRNIGLLLSVICALSACSDSDAPAKLSGLATVKIVSGNSQHGTVGTALASPIVIQAVDSNGHPAVGLNVAYGPSGGSVNPPSTTTDATGKASTVWTLGMTAGQQNLLATVIQGAAPGTILVTDTVYATANP